MKLRHTHQRLVATVLAAGLATAAVVGGSSAVWTAETANPSNSVTAGTFVLTNSKNTAPVFTAVTGAKPGSFGSDTVTLTNGGNTALELFLTQRGVTSNDLSTNLKLTIFDGTNCVYPAQSGACPTVSTGGGAAWNGSGTLDGTSAIGTLAASASRTYTVSWGLPSTVAGTTGQGQTASFDLTFRGDQGS